MSANLKLNLEPARVIVRDGSAQTSNAAARAHVATGRINTPVDKGRLRKSYRVDKRATASRPEAVVKLGQVEVDGEFVDYEQYVNYGYTHYKSGQHIPGYFMWEAGLEEGRRVADEGVREVAQALNSGRRRTFVETAETERVG